MHKKSRKTLAANLKWYMEARGINSQAAFQKHTGVAQTHIGSLLREEKGAGVDVLDDLAEGMRVPTFALLMNNDNFRVFADVGSTQSDDLELVVRPKSR